MDTAIHPVVVQILADMQPLVGGPRLGEAGASHWVEKVRQHPDRAVLALHLVVIARRFLDAGAGAAAREMLFLAVQVVGSDKASAALEAGGMDPASAQRAVQQAAASGLGMGLRPPGAKGVVGRGGRRTR